MTTSFLEPGFLWLLLLLPIFVLPIAGRRPKRAWLRLLVFGLLVIGLARPVLLRSSGQITQVVVMDRSASVAAAMRARSEGLLDRLLARPTGGAERVLINLGARPKAELEKGFDRRFDLGEGESSLSTALALALRVIPEGGGGSITLISDAAATDLRFAPVMTEAIERGIAIHVLGLDRDERLLRPVRLDLLDELRLGQVARLRVELSGAPRRAELDLRIGDDEVGSVDLLPGQDLIEVEIEAPRAGFFRLEARLLDQQGTVISSLGREVAVQDPLRLAYLGGRMAGGADKLSELIGPGFVLPTPNADAEPRLDDIDGLVLDDRPATELPPVWQQEIARAVREDGLGLFLSGGRSAFGPGGYHKTPIEEIAPVEFMQKEEKKDPSTTLAVIIDTSGSMVGNRMTIAKEVARLAIRRLEPHDKVGIVEFYGTKQWAAPIQSAANAIDLQRAINRLGAEGGTVLFPAVEEAYYALKNVDTRFKHVLVLTDAGVETGPYESLLRRMADDGVTVSTVLVGPGRHSEFLVELADWGGGRYYGAPDRFNLPELMLKKPNTSALPAYRPGLVEVEARGSRGWWGGDRPENLPPLEGFVETKPRPGAEMLMRTRGAGKPILASWHRGLGRVSALMTEPTGPGTSGWTNWSDYGRMLGRLLARTAAFKRPPFAIDLERRDWRLVIEARRLVTEVGRPELSRIDALGGATAIEFKEIAPGLFRAVLALASDEVVRLEAGAAERPRWRRRLVSDPRDERALEAQVAPGVGLDLAAAAAASGGRELTLESLPANWPESSGAGGFSATLLWPWALILALIAFLAEILLRRLPRSATETER